MRMPAPRPSVDVTAYRALLRLLPASFHLEFANDMASDFDDDRKEAIESSRSLAVWVFRARMFGDFGRTLCVQWLRTGWLFIGALAMASTFAVMSLVVRVWPRTILPVPAGGTDHDLIVFEMLVVILFLFIVTAILFTMWSARVVRRGARRRI